MTSPADYRLNYGSAPGMKASGFTFPNVDFDSGSGSVSAYPVDYGFNYGSAPGLKTSAFSVPGLDSGGSGGMPSAASFKFGMNAPTLQMGMQGLNSLGNLWGAFEAQKLAREQFNFTKGMANTNLNNSIKSYNTTLEDRARSRGFTEGQSSGQIQGYIDNNRLTR